MMKTKLFTTAGILLVNGLRALPVPMMKTYMTMGPYTKYQNNPLVSYKINSTYTTAKTIYEIFRFGDENNPNQQTITKPNHSIAAKGTYEGYVTIPTKTFLGDNGMSITLDVFDENGSKLRSGSVHIYPINSETIDPTTYNKSNYQCPHTKAKLNNSLPSYIDENYTFSKVDDYFLSDIYYRLDVGQFEIQTSLDESDFTYDSAYLYILGNEEYFPGLSFTDGKATIPLKVVYNTGRLYFQFLNTLYVESRLLIMSTTPKNNYKATPHFYLPVNHCDDLMGSDFLFEINGAGLNKTTFRWTSTLISGSPIVGNCQNSGYCVIGKVSK